MSYNLTFWAKMTVKKWYGPKKVRPYHQKFCYGLGRTGQFASAAYGNLSCLLWIVESFFCICRSFCCYCIATYCWSLDSACFSDLNAFRGPSVIYVLDDYCFGLWNLGCCYRKQGEIVFFSTVCRHSVINSSTSYPYGRNLLFLHSVGTVLYCRCFIWC